MKNEVGCVLIFGWLFLIMIGIYKITNVKGKVYVGQSIDLHKRFSDYKRLLRSKQI